MKDLGAPGLANGLQRNWGAGDILRLFYGFYVVAVIALLVVPYATGAIDYAFNVAGVLPIRPVYYMLGMGSLVAATAVFSLPRLNAAVLCLFLLLGWRLLDAALLQRVDGLLYNPVLSSGAALFFVACLWLASSNVVQMRWATLITGILVVSIVAGMNIYEWRFPGSFSTVLGRSAGMLGNANDAAMTIVLMLALLASMHLRPNLMVVLTCLGGVGVYFTLSRGGWIMFGVFCVHYLTVLFRQKRRLILTSGAIAAMVLLIGGQFIEIDPLVSERNVTQRVAMLRSGVINDADDTGRLTLLIKGLQVFSEEPFIGYGTGTSAEKLSPHNMFLAVALDNGLGAMALYLSGLIYLFRTAARRRSHWFVVLLPMLIATFLSHNLTENNTYLFCWVICAMQLDGPAFPLTSRNPSPGPLAKHGTRPPGPNGRHVGVAR